MTWNGPRRLQTAQNMRQRIRKAPSVWVTNGARLILAGLTAARIVPELPVIEFDKPIPFVNKFGRNVAV